MSEYLETSKQYKGYHYSVIDPDQLQYLHQTTLEMLKVIVPIFEKYHIRYMICGGTLLGAATTGHFIPWDDDVDICVIEDDYERMKHCLIQETPDWMLVQCRETEPNYYHGWIKVRDKSSRVYPYEEKYACNGVWVDIYKLTKARKKDVSYIICKEHLNYLVRRHITGGLTFREMMRRIWARGLLVELPKEKIKAIIQKDQSSIYIIWSASKILVDELWCFPENEYCFEGMSLNSFRKADDYLTQHYGNNFRELPPDEQRRVGIHQVDVF